MRLSSTGGGPNKKQNPTILDGIAVALFIISTIYLIVYSAGCAERPNPYDVSCFDKNEIIIYGGECYAPVTDQNYYYCYDDGRQRYPTITVSIPTGGRCVILPKDQRSLSQ